MPRAETYWYGTPADEGQRWLEVGTFLNPTIYADNMFRIDFYLDLPTAGTKSICSAIYPSGGWYFSDDFDAGVSSGDWYDEYGTIRAVIRYVLPMQSYAGIPRYGSAHLMLLSDAGLGEIATSTYGFNFPEILGTAGTSFGTTFLWAGTGNRTYYDKAYTSPAAGTLSKIAQGTNDTTSISIVKKKYSYKGYSDSCTTSAQKKPILWKRPPEVVQVSETHSLSQYKFGQYTDWHFSPKYTVLFDEYGNGTLATTNWEPRIEEFGQLQKSIRHWSGDFQVGNWQPTFVDENNEIYGSLYGSSTASESRFKDMSIYARTTFFSGVQQFRGEIRNTEWEEGIARFDLVDKLKGLPESAFIWDYQNIAVTNGGQIYGIVKRVIGTCVMIEDKGDIQWIERKQPGRSWLQSALSGAINGIMTGIISGGNPWAIGIGFAAGVYSSRPSGDRVIGGYYKVDDFNLIPDDLVKSGQKMKFYWGSINGQATNTNNPLFEIKEYTTTGGTFLLGLRGTIYFDDVSGINVGDYIYVRKPAFYAGSPLDVIKGILTGSNIDYPYQFGSREILNCYDGMCQVDVIGTSDFADTFLSEIQNIENFYISKIFGDDDVSPFEEVRKICNDTQLSFFINEENQFDCRSIAPKGLISPIGIATYSKGVNILSGFSFNRIGDEAISGVRLYYDYSGETTSVKKSGYNKLIELSAPNPVIGAGKWLEVESEWLRDSIDAKIVAYRILLDKQSGEDKITLPTTLYGLTHQLTDLIRVSHTTGSLTNTLFEIDGYNKNLSKSEVTLSAFNVQKSYGWGNCKWTATTHAVDSGTQSGYAISGRKSSWTRCATFLTATVFSDQTLVGITSHLSSIAYLTGHIVAIGSNTDAYCELCYVDNAAEGIFGFRAFYLERGVFDTIQKTYFSGNQYFYDLGPAQYDRYGNMLKSSLDGIYEFGTTIGINTNIGTAFKFF